MPRKLFRDISASTIQVIISQLLGLVLFLLTSRWLGKELFGELNWSLAIATLCVSVATMGMELIVMRRIARGDDIRTITGIYTWHLIFSGGSILLLLVLAALIAPQTFSVHFLFPAILASQLISLFTSPFKQITNGIRSFDHLALLSVISNAVKVSLLIIAQALDMLSATAIAWIYIIAAIVETITGLYLVTRRMGLRLFPLHTNPEAYFSLVRESLPQFGVTFFNIILARFDWILLGIFTTTVITAEYSFAYRVFELSRIPLLILSPVLMPVFIAIFRNDAVLSARQHLKLDLLFRIEMAVSVLLPILLISCWTPLMESLTLHKYGGVNEQIFIVLSCCIPLQFATDYYWNLCFAQNQMKLTFLVAIGSGLLNISLNVLLIPIYAGTGAAIAYLSSFVAQLMLFYLNTREHQVKPNLQLLFKTFLCAAAALLLSRQLVHDPVVSVTVALLLYFTFSIITGLVVLKKIKPAIRFFLIR